MSNPSDTAAEALDDFRWLASAEAAAWFERIAGQAPVSPALAARLRRELTARQTHRLLEQAELRQRAAEKFPAAEAMLFTRRGLEQATDWYLAQFKAARFTAAPLAEAARLFDLCCGIGGDAAALAGCGHCEAVDRDPVMAYLAAHNAEVQGRAKLSSRTADAEQVALTADDLWHIDPDRRRDGRRKTRVEAYQPGLDFLDELSQRGRGGAIKLAPAARLPAELSARAELQWISRGGQCKQCLAWFGELAERPGGRMASVLDRRGRMIDSIAAAPAEAALENRAAAGTMAVGLKRYVFDPDAAVLAARLAPQLARERGLEVIDARSSYLTGDHLPSEGSLAAFEVCEHLPLDPRRLRAVLAQRNVGRLELKKRGAPVDLPLLARKLRTSGQAEATVIITPWQAGHQAIVCRRVTPATAGD